MDKEKQYWTDHYSNPPACSDPPVITGIVGGLLSTGIGLLTLILNNNLVPALCLTISLGSLSGICLGTEVVYICCHKYRNWKLDKINKQFNDSIKPETVIMDD
jgi:hypothetical protein